MFGEDRNHPLSLSFTFGPKGQRYTYQPHCAIIFPIKTKDKRALPCKGLLVERQIKWKGDKSADSIPFKTWTGCNVNKISYVVQCKKASYNKII